MPFDSTDYPVTKPAIDNANLRGVRDLLNNLPRGGRFAMATHSHFCGAPACIAGWADYMMGNHRERTFHAIGADLGLTKMQSDLLFVPYGLMSNGEPAIYCTDPHRAVTVLDHLIATGEVDWSRA